ncbi:VPLPA-CTERM protein sorting domain-containing protein [Rhodovulum sp. ES.010]|uniref:hypothetical protein n=1 Tax=Rhodovulum sp. ES.010 TaxID=1882821 RepID=UPI00092BB9A8|nr:hypothetical protein [Rhodovulum sp. ES.010]SIO22063.1 VPLPA-CTERM protein sorting domain-containing protein [Rhodovulum sp. ES.010]
MKPSSKTAAAAVILLLCMTGAAPSTAWLDARPLVGGDSARAVSATRWSGARGRLSALATGLCLRPGHGLCMAPGAGQCHAPAEAGAAICPPLPAGPAEAVPERVADAAPVTIPGWALAPVTAGPPVWGTSGPGGGRPSGPVAWLPDASGAGPEALATDIAPPASGPAVVPLPPGLILLLGGIAALAGLRRKPG